MTLTPDLIGGSPLDIGKVVGVDVATTLTSKSNLLG
jgi:hypothetical protein